MGISLCDCQSLGEEMKGGNPVSMRQKKKEDGSMPNLSELFFQSVDGVFAVDAKQRIIFWNTACEQLFGISSKVAIGRPCSEVVRGKDTFGDTFCRGGCCVARLTEGYNAPRTFPLRVPDKRGEQLNLSVSILLVPSRQKDMWTCVHLLHRGEATETLEQLSTSADPAIAAAAAEALALVDAGQPTSACLAP